MLNDKVIRLAVLNTKFRAGAEMSRVEFTELVDLLVPDGGIPFHTIERVVNIIDGMFDARIGA